jgi:hypothetical protein
MFLGRKTGWVEILAVHGSLAGLAAIQTRIIRRGQTMPWPPEKYCFADALRNSAETTATTAELQPLRPKSGFADECLAGVFGRLALGLALELALLSWLTLELASIYHFLACPSDGQDGIRIPRHTEAVRPPLARGRRRRDGVEPYLRFPHRGYRLDYDSYGFYPCVWNNRTMLSFDPPLVFFSGSVRIIQLVMWLLGEWFSRTLYRIFSAVMWVGQELFLNLYGR